MMAEQRQPIIVLPTLKNYMMNIGRELKIKEKYLFRSWSTFNRLYSGYKKRDKQSATLCLCLSCCLTIDNFSYKLRYIKGICERDIYNYLVYLYRIPCKYYKKYDYISSGSFGRVYSSNDYVIKEMNMDVDTIREIYFGYQGFRGMITLISCFTEGNKVNLVYERGVSTLRNRDVVSTDYELLSKRIILSVEQMHNQRIIHRDLKEENIILFEHDIVKICDFNTVAHGSMKYPSNYVVTTLTHRSPKLLLEDHSLFYSYEDDIFALACILKQLLSISKLQLFHQKCRYAKYTHLKLIYLYFEFCDEDDVFGRMMISTTFPYLSQLRKVYKIYPSDDTVTKMKRMYSSRIQNIEQVLSTDLYHRL